MTMALGQPGFFKPHFPIPWFSQRGARTATIVLRQRALARDPAATGGFRSAEQGGTRYACGAVNVLNGNFAYFDSGEVEIIPEHVMASGALPPALPMVQIGTTTTGTAGWFPIRRCNGCWRAPSMSRRWCSRSTCSAHADSCRATCTMSWRGRRTSSIPAGRGWSPTTFAASHERDLLLRHVLNKVPEEALSERRERTLSISSAICRRSPSCS